MIIVYSPKGGEPEHYDANELKVSEASIAQRTVDMRWAEIKEGIERDDIDAMRVVVWLLKKRQDQTLRFSEFDPGVNDMVSRMDRDEVRRYAENAFAQVGATPEITREYVAQILQELPDVAADPEHARRLVAEMAKDPKEDEAPEPEPFGVEGSPPSSQSPTSGLPGTDTSASSGTSSTTPPTSSTT